MTTEEKIRLGLLALSVLSAVVVASHLGHVPTIHALLDGIRPGPPH